MNDLSPAARRNVEHVPQLEYVNPYCSVCGKTTYFDTDYFRCDDCKIHWSTHFEPEWDNEHLPACGQRHDLDEELPVKTPVVCQLDAGHDGPHAGYNPAELTKYSGPPDWYRWDPTTGEREW